MEGSNGRDEKVRPGAPPRRTPGEAAVDLVKAKGKPLATESGSFAAASQWAACMRPVPSQLIYHRARLPPHLISQVKKGSARALTGTVVCSNPRGPRNG